MSQWTHVSGIIRLDYAGDIMIRGAKPNVIPVIEQIIKINLPEGSEGPVEFDITKTRQEFEMGVALSWGHVSIWGDLRDYDNSDKILVWFGEMCKAFKNKLFLIRDATLHIDIEFRPGIMLIWDSEREAVVSLNASTEIEAER